LVNVQYVGLLVVAAVAFVAPLLARLIPRGLVAPVVLEVVGGIVVGPQVLGLVHPTGGVYLLYLLGFGFLLFLAGQEIELERFRGPTFQLTGASYLLSLAVAFPIAYGIRAIAAGADVRLIALALTASTLGVLVPVLRDVGEVESDFGQLVIMAGSVGEFAALLLLTILFSAGSKPVWEQVSYVVGLAVVAFLAAIGMKKLWQSSWLRRTLLATDQNTSQLRVRGAFLILLIFGAATHEFGVDTLLGAFVAGIVLRVADTDDRPTQERYRGKLLAIGFGFLVPVFFIVTGVRFDVRSLTHPSTLALLPVLLAAILVARACPALLYRKRVGNVPALAAGLLQATTLTFPVVVAEVGTSIGLLSAPLAAALIGAALLSVLLFPAAALALRPWTRPLPGTPPAYKQRGEGRGAEPQPPPQSNRQPSIDGLPSGAHTRVVLTRPSY
jgi:Kef-type K+ transport system membrane component KefB